jgi:hypothetical protein
MPRMVLDAFGSDDLTWLKFPLTFNRPNLVHFWTSKTPPF